ncbi:MAG: sulfatase-like hydrolase/transferase [Lachnospiraceae bacterium]|nr:sulfatase-like hydrolase/transferase [Lachnospiraceae bacterium]
MRNLILMHLESLNFVNYRVNRDKFPNLSFWEKRSLSFANYFSTATSTLMVLGDLMYGGMQQYEMCSYLNYIPEKYCYQNSLFDCLESRGYVTEVLCYPDDEDFEGGKKRHIAGFQSEMKAFQQYEDYLREAERVMDTGKPFAMLLVDVISNVAVNYRIPNGRCESGLDRRRRGYQYMDACAGRIFDLLEEKNLADNTTIIFYGDHGDEYFAHGNHKGLTHAIEPYASLVHTPLWIYDNRLTGNKSCSDLISTIDIRGIAERMLDMPEETFSWRQLNLPERRHVLTRNAYAAQPVRSGSFNKGYALIDGRFLFMASNNGLEMYDIEMDMQCQNNLLNYFTYEQGILHLNKELNESLNSHYRYIFDMGTIRQIRQNFYFYREELYEKVLELFFGAECEDRITDINFEQIHYI